MTSSRADLCNPSSKDNGNVYYRDEVSVEVGQGDTVSTTWQRIKTNREWRGELLSRRACLKNISQYWHGEAGSTEIRDGEGNIVLVWNENEPLKIKIKIFFL